MIYNISFLSSNLLLLKLYYHYYYSSIWEITQFALPNTTSRDRTVFIVLRQS